MIYYLIILFFILEYVRPMNYAPALSVLRLNTLVPLLVVVGSLVIRNQVSAGEILREWNTRLLFFLLGMIGLSVLYAEVTFYAFEIFTGVLGYVLIYYALAKQLTDIDRVKGVFKVLVFVHLVLAALTPQMFLDPGARHYLASGTFLGDGNDYALSVCLVIPLCLFLMTDAKRILQKLYYALALGVLVFCVIATQSRGGTLALVFAGIYYWLKTDKKVITGAIAVAALAGVMVFAPPAYFKRMDTLAAISEDGSAQGRISAWKAGTKMALYNPLGVGAGQFPANYIRYAPEQQTHWMTAHSIYFLILGELGFLGLFTLLGYLASNVVANRRVVQQIRGAPPDVALRSTRLINALGVSLMAYAVAGAFLSAIYYPHMYVLGGLLVASRRIVRELALVPATSRPEAAAAKVVSPTSIRIPPRSRFAS
jgi:probable O-glycosylation ligase (exosortase A-associated)